MHHSEEFPTIFVKLEYDRVVISQLRSPELTSTHWNRRRVGSDRQKRAWAKNGHDAVTSGSGLRVETGEWEIEQWWEFRIRMTTERGSSNKRVREPYDIFSVTWDRNYLAKLSGYQSL